MPKNKIKPDENGVYRLRLNNGAMVLVREDRSTPVVSLNLWVEAGSIDERPDERGMAHLIEHMIFKGTSQRGVGEISREVEAAGGYLNAFTSYEHTCFYVVLPSSKIEKALEVEFDAYLHSTFDKGELAKEKEVVFEEMRMRRDDPWSWSWEMLFGALFRKNPYHWPVIGDMKILKNVPRERLLKYYRTHYVPSNTVLSVVGDVSGPRVLQWVEKNFANLKRPAPPRRRFQNDTEPKSLRLLLEPGDVQQIYLSLGFPTVPLTHPDSPPLEILESLLSEGASGRLNLNIREKAQSADEIGADHFSGKFGGAFTFQALTDEKRLEKVLTGIMDELRKMIEKGPGGEELAKVKNKVKAAKVFEKQNVDGQAKSLGFWELQGDYRLEEKLLKELDSVSSGDVQRVAREYLLPRRSTLLIYHPRSKKMQASSGVWQTLMEKALEPAEIKRHRSFPAASVQKLRLKNGSTLLIKGRHGLPLVSLGVFLKGGFFEETERKSGITNLMAKCLLKGTKTRDHAVYSREVEGLAAHLDSSMEKDYWGLTLDVLRPNFEKSLDLMIETLLEPAFSVREVEKEKKLQIAAIKRLKDDPSEKALLHSDVITFVGTPYAHMPMGTIESVSGISRKDVLEWHRRGLSSPNMIWVAIGDFDFKRLRELLDLKLGGLRSQKGQSSPGKTPPPPVPSTLEMENEGQQANMVMGFRAPSFGSPDYFPFRVLNTLLNGMGGRLFVELREKKSLAYSVYGSHDAGRIAGIYQVYIGCAPQKRADAKRELLRVLRSVSRDGISGEELDRAKTYMIGLYQVGLQANRSQVHSYARYEIAGPGAAWVEAFPELIRKVTTEDIHRVARRYLDTDQKTWVVLAPEKTKEG